MEKNIIKEGIDDIVNYITKWMGKQTKASYNISSPLRLYKSMLHHDSLDKVNDNDLKNACNIAYKKFHKSKELTKDLNKESISDWADYKNEYWYDDKNHAIEVKKYLESLGIKVRFTKNSKNRYKLMWEWTKEQQNKVKQSDLEEAKFIVEPFDAMDEVDDFEAACKKSHDDPSDFENFIVFIHMMDYDRAQEKLMTREFRKRYPYHDHANESINEVAFGKQTTYKKGDKVTYRWKGHNYNDKNKYIGSGNGVVVAVNPPHGHYASTGKPFPESYEVKMIDGTVHYSRTAKDLKLGHSAPISEDLFPHPQKDIEEAGILGRSPYEVTWSRDQDGTKQTMKIWANNIMDATSKVANKYGFVWKVELVKEANYVDPSNMKRFSIELRKLIEDDWDMQYKIHGDTLMFSSKQRTVISKDNAKKFITQLGALHNKWLVPMTSTFIGDGGNNFYKGIISGGGKKLAVYVGPITLMNESIYKKGQKLKATSTAQGLQKGERYTVNNVDSKNTPFGDFVSYIVKDKNGKTLSITNGHLLLSPINEDLIPGGLSSGKKPEDFNQIELNKGTKVEMEHTGDVNVAREIAMDHLTEDPNYYIKLAKMEAESYNNNEPDAYAKTMASISENINSFKQFIPNWKALSDMFANIENSGDQSFYSKYKSKGLDPKIINDIIELAVSTPQDNKSIIKSFTILSKKYNINEGGPGSGLRGHKSKEKGPREDLDAKKDPKAWDTMKKKTAERDAKAAEKKCPKCNHPMTAAGTCSGCHYPPNFCQCSTVKEGLFPKPKPKTIIRPMMAEAKQDPNSEFLKTELGKKYIELVKKVHQANNALDKQTKDNFKQLRREADNAENNEVTFRKKYIIPNKNLTWNIVSDLADAIVKS